MASSTARRVTLMGYGPNSVQGAWKAREEFDANGTLTSVYTLWPQSGRLNESERGRLDSDALNARESGASLYVVYSYATPIAWVIRFTDGTESVYHVAQKFSVTTSKHSGRLY